MLYDSVGSMRDAKASSSRSCARDGIEVREFRPMNPVENAAQSGTFTIAITARSSWSTARWVSPAASTSTARTRAPRAASPVRSAGMEDGWRDTHVRIEGPAVAQLQQLFMDTWNEAGERTSFDGEGGVTFPTLRPAGDDLVTIVAQRQRVGRSLALRDVPRGLHTFDRAAVDHARVFRAQRRAAGRHGRSGAARRRRAAHRAGLHRFENRAQGDASRHTRDCSRAACASTSCSDALLHAKSVVVDGAVSIVGSANLDMRSFMHNDEVNADRDLTRRSPGAWKRCSRATSVNRASSSCRAGNGARCGSGSRNSGRQPLRLLDLEGRPRRHEGSSGRSVGREVATTS